MTTGCWLKSKGVTAGSTPSGSSRPPTASSRSATAASTSVPYANCAMTNPIELAEVELTVSMPSIDCTAFSIGATTSSTTSSAAAPGYGAMIETIGNEIAGTSSCFRLPQDRMPAMKSPAAIRMVTLRRLTAARLSQVIWVPRIGRPPHRSRG